MRNLRRLTARTIACALLAALPIAAAQTSDTVPAPVIPVPITTPTPGLSTSTTVSVVPARERFTVWGGLSGEYIVLPGLDVSLSRPVGPNLTVRGTLAATFIPLAGDSASGGGFGVLFPLASANVDLLFGRTTSGTRLYAGPSVGLLFGPTLLIGGVAGVRGEFRGGPWGYFAEGKLRALLTPGAALPVPTLNIGVTYRF